MATQPASSIRLEKVTKRFSGVTAVDEASVEVRSGEIHGLIGRNGAGKTVMVSMIAGALKPTSGEIVVRGTPVEQNWTPAQAHALGVSLIPQEPLFATNRSIVENLFMGNAVRRFGVLLDHRAMRRKAAEIIELLGVRAVPNQAIESLSIEDQQLLAFGKALYVEHARVLLLDEITASLPAHRTERLLQLLQDTVREQDDLSITLISHHISEIIKVCDRVTVLRDGRVVETVGVADTDSKHLADMIVGPVPDDTGIAAGASTPTASSSTTAAQSAATGGVAADARDEQRPATAGEAEPAAAGTEPARGQPVLLGVQGLRVGTPIADTSNCSVVREATLEVRKGEVVGVVGLEGSGKDEFLRALAGVERIVEGDVRLDGRSYVPKSPADAVDAGIVYLSRHRDEEALIRNCSVMDNMLLPVYRRHLRTRWGVIDGRRSREVAHGRVRSMQVKTPGIGTLVDHLSGGNQQRVLLSRLLEMRPQLFLLDEPGRGVDIAGTAAIHELIRTEFVSEAAVIVSSESEDDLIALCDRVHVFFDGQVTATLESGDQCFQSEQLYKAIQGVPA
jgi:ABC-type sugar transport system ATPase subunit